MYYNFVQLKKKGFKMPINAIHFTSSAPAVAVQATETKAPDETQIKKSNKSKIVAIGISAAALAAMAAIAIKNKGKVGKIPTDFVLGEYRIKKLAGLKNANDINKVIADVAERTSEAGVNKWLEHFGEGAEHIVQKASIVAEEAAKAVA